MGTCSVRAEQRRDGGNHAAVLCIHNIRRCRKPRQEGLIPFDRDKRHQRAVRVRYARGALNGRVEEAHAG
ncbi:Protein of unknown function [Pyronema omphalodes CBS 100304]|uniref:Uncharacterized protein n=1 Tax=Pyronema omphalodes (strain CBS 100304) TaxID=1076935 RepID=U4LN15_PYROM|nr:Protein of unknown function [Pyronema omphalodes CBS 100304]